MTATDELTDVETIEHLDFEPQCDVPRCERTARFRVHCRFCPDVSLGCEGHVRLLIQKNQEPGGAFECQVCHRIESDLYALVTIHPVKP